MHKYRNPNI